MLGCTPSAHCKTVRSGVHVPAGPRKEVSATLTWLAEPGDEFGVARWS
jgi:hypothetical protein